MKTRAELKEEKRTNLIGELNQLETRKRILNDEYQISLDSLNEKIESLKLQKEAIETLKV